MSDLDPTVSDPERVPETPPVDHGPWMALSVVLVVLLAAGGILACVSDHPGAAAGQWAAAAPKPAGSESAVPGGTHRGPLSELLLPRPTGYQAAPDTAGQVPGTGPDSAQVLARVAAMVGAPPTAAPGTARKSAAGTRVDGTGLRSFRGVADDHVIRIQLQRTDLRVAGTATRIVVQLMDGVRLLKKGPRVPGHPEAHCYLSSLAEHATLQDMTCVAAEGDLMVSFDAYGTEPIAERAVVTVLKEQLDRVATPGRSV